MGQATLEVSRADTCDLAIALSRVHIPSVEVSAGHVEGQVYCATGTDVRRVHIAVTGPGRQA